MPSPLRVYLTHRDRHRLAQGWYEFDDLRQFADFLVKCGRLKVKPVSPAGETTWLAVETHTGIDGPTDELW